MTKKIKGTTLKKTKPKKTIFLYIAVFRIGKSDGTFDTVLFNNKKSYKKNIDRNNNHGTHWNYHS